MVLGTLPAALRTAPEDGVQGRQEQPQEPADARSAERETRLVGPGGGCAGGPRRARPGDCRSDGLQHRPPRPRSGKTLARSRRDRRPAPSPRRDRREGADVAGLGARLAMLEKRITPPPEPNPKMER